VAIRPALKVAALRSLRLGRRIAGGVRFRREDRRLAAAEQAALAELGRATLADAPSGSLGHEVEALRRRRELKRAFHAHEPWVTRFDLHGDAYGGTFLPPAILRERFAEAFPGVASILELGSLEGGHTFPLAALPGVEQVVAVEGRPENVARAEVVRQALGVTNVRFVLGNLEELDLTTLGRFDAVYCTGLLYHLPRPWELVSRLREVSERLYVWTQCAEAAVPGEEAGGYAGRTYREWGGWDPLSGLSASSFWPTREELVRLLADAGFPHVHVFGEEHVARRGPAVTLAAAARVELLGVAPRLSAPAAATR
jgi:SAM-dependent methyltransferase